MCKCKHLKKIGLSSIEHCVTEADQQSSENCGDILTFIFKIKSV